MAFLIPIICTLQIKCVIFLAFLNAIIAIIAHIKNKTYDYDRALDFMARLSGYLVVIIVFSTISFMGVTGFVYAYNVVCGLIALYYARKILDGLMLLGLNVSAFLPFLKYSQKRIERQYGVGLSLDSVRPSKQTKINFW